MSSGVIKAALNFIWLVDTLCGCCSCRFLMQLAHDSRALIPTSLLVIPIERGLVGGLWDQLLLSCQALGWDWGRRRSRRGPAGASSSNDTSTNSWWHPGHFSEREWEQLVIMPLSNLTIQPQLTPYYYPTALIALSALGNTKCTWKFIDTSLSEEIIHLLTTRLYHIDNPTKTTHTPIDVHRKVMGPRSQSSSSWCSVHSSTSTDIAWTFLATQSSFRHLWLRS